MATTGTGTTRTTKTTDDHDTERTESDASGVRRESQNQTDQVAMVSRTATGEAHQHPGYEVIGLPDNATAEQKAAAENRPEH